MKIAIIGGGISGLATAFYINELRPDVQITLFEKNEKLGGSMMTEEVEGFFFEAGSNGFLSNKPDTLALIEQCGCQDILIRSNDSARKRFIYKDFLCPLPETAKAFLKTPLISFTGKLRVACEYFISPKKDDTDETLQSFGYRRVGKEMTDVFLDAMVAGIFGSTPAKISVNSAFPAVVRLERDYGGLFKGMRAKKKKEAGPGGILMSFKEGVSTFINRLATVCGAEIKTNCTVKDIKQKNGKYSLISQEEEMLFDKVILAVPSYACAQLLQNIDKYLAKDLEEIEYSPISIVGFGYNNLAHDLDGFGLLTTTSSKKSILGVLWDSSIFNDRAPEGKKSVRVMIGGQRSPDLARKSHNELVGIAKKGILETMGISTNPDVVYVRQYERGIPNYGVGHQDKMTKIFNRLKQHKGLYFNSNAYFGVAINDCVSNSKKCARSIVEELGSTKR